ncbi:hypothetical protein EDE12_1282 [Methylosinus sp. sav-2]|nr:hypothetical protein EDE12_1282 [Methylosinus sp. sav-2]
MTPDDGHPFTLSYNSPSPVSPSSSQLANATFAPIVRRSRRIPLSRIAPRSRAHAPPRLGARPGRGRLEENTVWSRHATQTSKSLDRQRPTRFAIGDAAHEQNGMSPHEPVCRSMRVRPGVMKDEILERNEFARAPQSGCRVAFNSANPALGATELPLTGSSSLSVLPTCWGGRSQDRVVTRWKAEALHQPFGRPAADAVSEQPDELDDPLGLTRVRPRNIG